MHAHWSRITKSRSKMISPIFEKGVFFLFFSSWGTGVCFYFGPRAPWLGAVRVQKKGFQFPLCTASQQVKCWALVLTSERARFQVFVVPPVTQGRQLPNQVVVSPFELILGECLWFESHVVVQSLVVFSSHQTVHMDSKVHTQITILWYLRHHSWIGRKRFCYFLLL